jgi:dephospho-CoA kinase
MEIDTNKPIILTFVGMTGSGKDTVTDYVKKKYDVPVIHFGNMVYDEVRSRGLDIVEFEKEVREDMRAKEGLEVLAKRATIKAREYIADGKNRVVLNGLYSWSEYKYLEKEFGDQFVCIALMMPRRLRYQRLLNRDDPERRYTLEQIKAREVQEIERSEKGGPIARADYVLMNDRGFDVLQAEIDALLKEIGF